MPVNVLLQTYGHRDLQTNSARRAELVKICVFFCAMNPVHCRVPVNVLLQSLAARGQDVSYCDGNNRGYIIYCTLLNLTEIAVQKKFCPLDCLSTGPYILLGYTYSQ